MIVKMIWAQSYMDRVIGVDGSIPWYIPEDMAHFKKKTEGSTVLMGRKTWESLPERFRPLPGRKNIVLTRQLGYEAPGARVIHTMPIINGRVSEALGGPDETLWVIGGAEIYELMLPLAKEVVVTEVTVLTMGDAFAPSLKVWDWVGTFGQWQNSSAGPAYRFSEFKRLPS